MRQLIAVALFCAAIVCFKQYADAQVPMTGAGLGAPSSGGGGCSQATTFVTNTGISGSDSTNYTNLICGLVTDGVWNSLDALFVLAAPSSTVALFNLVTAATTATTSGTPTFSAYHGYSNPGSSQMLTNINLTSTTNYKQNAASLGVWNHTDTTNGNPLVAANADNTNIFYFTDGSIYTRINDSSSAGGLASAHGNGLILGVRTSSTGRTSYYNGSSLGSLGSVSSAAVTATNVLFPDISNTVNVISAVVIGGNIDSVQGNLYTRLQTYMTAVGN